MKSGNRRNRYEIRKLKLNQQEIRNLSDFAISYAKPVHGGSLDRSRRRKFWQVSEPPKLGTRLLECDILKVKEEPHFCWMTIAFFPFKANYFCDDLFSNN